MTTTLPHEREILTLVELCVECQEPGKLILIVTDHMQHVQWIMTQLHNAISWDKGRVNIARDYVEILTPGGGKSIIKVAPMDGYALVGIRPDKIVLMGRVGEFYYHLMGMESTVIGVA